MVEGLTVEDIRKGDVKGVKVNGVLKYRSRSPSQGTCSPYIEEKHYARFDACRPYS